MIASTGRGPRRWSGGKALTPGGEGLFLKVECEVPRVPADERIVVPGTQHVDPARWSPLIHDFRHYHGLAPEVGHGFRSETTRMEAGDGALSILL
ncbi:hypothetical protein SGLAU_28370 [Streptomyces glaucescens]|uniref:Uncharacterized protein n=1 Tax=Streptomyces glaucescens TaxID=1907 RepID=A0A089Z756_STRGA|nr:hypothetical protein SGLAU_28370 [Streptomyces glaucescens]